MKSPVARLRIQNLAGYTCLEWKGLAQNLNLLVGQNGVGKSTLLEALVVALNHRAGRHSRDAVCRANPQARFEIQFAGDTNDHGFTGIDVLSQQGAKRTGWSCHLLQIVENRQPKNRVGKVDARQAQNPIMRYADTISRLKGLLESESQSQQRIAGRVFDYCALMTAAGTEEEWGWIRDEIRNRGPRGLRPSSCGQFDILATLLDLVEFEDKLASEPDLPAYVIMDCPSTYLHPACLRPLLDLLRNQLANAQFFVTTHSTKLLTYPRPKSIFWLSRDARAQDHVELQNIRTLRHGSRAAFFELYGEDTSPGLFSLLGELESPEAHRFLADCALNCYSKPRGQPGVDPQVQLVVESIPTGARTLVDFGAGHGDLLAALESSGRLDGTLEYVALERDAPEKLNSRVGQLIDRGLISSSSRVIGTLEESPATCTIATFLNVVHNLSIHDLACFLYEFLWNRRDRELGGQVLVSELRTLAEGERAFILWTFHDFSEIFADVESVSVVAWEHAGRHKFEAIDATALRLEPSASVEDFPTVADLEGRLWRALVAKRGRALDELAELRLCGSRKELLDQRWHQHRVAFLCAHVAWMCAAEHKNAKGRTQDPNS